MCVYWFVVGMLLGVSSGVVGMYCKGALCRSVCSGYVVAVYYTCV